MHTVAVRPLFSLLFTWLVCAGAFAQDPAASQGGSDSPAAIQRQIDVAKADNTLGEELRPALLEALEKALAATKGLETYTASTASYTAERDSAPDRLKAARDEISALGTTAEPVVPPNTNLRDLEGLLAKAQAEQTTSSESVSELEREAARRSERRAAIPGRLADAQRQLEALPAEPVLDPALDKRVAEARRLRQQLERRQLQAEIRSLEVELGSYEARGELLTARRDLASRKQQVARTRVEFFANRVKELRAQEAARSEAEAKRAAAEASSQHPLLAALATENATIAAQLPVLASSQAEVQSHLARMKMQKQELGAQFEDIKARALRAGTSAAIGSLLRERRAQLADVDRLTRRTAGKGGDVADTYLAALDWEQRRRALVDDAAQLDRLLQDAEPPIPAGPAGERVRSQARTLLDDRLRMLETLASGWSTQLGNIEERATTQVLLTDLVAHYRTFINERVLWIRSSQPIWRITFHDISSAAQWLVSPAAWGDTLATLAMVSIDFPFSTLTALVLLVLLTLRPRLLSRLRRVGERASRGSNTLYGPTASALFYTFLLALPLPGMLMLAGMHLYVHPDCSEFGKAMGTGAISSAGMLGLVRALRATVRPGGLAEHHFHWSANTLGLFRSNLVLLLPAAFPLALLLGAFEHHADDAWLGSLGRLLLVAFLTLQLVFLWRTLHPVRGVLGNAKRNSLLYRGRITWFVCAVGTPSALLVMALLGFDYTALQLSQRLTDTVILVLACALVHALILRGLMLARRRMLLEQMRARMRLAHEAAHESGEAEGDGKEEPAEEVALDPSSIALQTQAILRAAVVIAAISIAYRIWIDVLPALGIFRQVVLWMDHSVNPAVPVTLANVLSALIVVLITVLAARNLPGLLELVVLQRFKLPAGERHAVTTLARYILIAVGAVITFSSMGIGWSQVQWLVAGLSLGLGFGLQEIFANFVSGLILLLERPVRVGDIVVLGDLLGKVSRIRIRATTIRDLDNKEMVVPNKEFVTGRFVNWTLTDSMVRLRVNVGVAYGSDTRKARELLVRAATEAPRAAKSPRPKALFLGFGDSTLDLELRVYIEDYDEHADLLDDLHTRIDDLFREHHIEIAFPQRDLHLRSARPLVEFFERKALPVEDLR
ncbi:MAG: mechanosensitive ion channel domain-containing protein [Planctomycetota bacterium]